MTPNNNELLGIVRDQNRACVDRGEAIDELVRSGMLQKEIANSTSLSKEAISHLKKCFRHLKGKAREMCRAGKMNGDACYSLANAPDSDQERILQRAIELSKTKGIRSKGRRSPPGQVTDKEIKQAIEDLQTA
jgi:transposase